MPKKKDDGLWHVNMRPNGTKGRQFKRKFKKKNEAIAFENWVTATYSQAKPHEVNLKQDRTRLSELVDVWEKSHGSALNDIRGRMGKFALIIEVMGDPVASKLTASDWAKYREYRLQGCKKLTKVKPATVNRDQAYLRGMFNDLIRSGLYAGENPLKNIRELKEKSADLTFYTIEQLNTLFAALENSNSEHVTMVAKICLAVGARWSEAETLSPNQIQNGRITFNKTKSNKARSIPIPVALKDELARYPRYSANKMFSDCLTAFRRAIEKTNLTSPRGQCTHVLRHSFAVHFMESGGNLVDLMNTLGHANIQTTAIYLRFSPTHLKDVPRLTPINKIKY